MYPALVDKGILLQLQNTPQQLSRVVEAVRLEELEVELQRLALKEKENYINDLETMLELELELGAASPVTVLVDPLILI